MAQWPDPVAAFLRGRRFAVAGVSRDPAQPANAVYRKLRDSGYVVIATHPNVSVDLVRQCADRGVGRVWLHRSFGVGSVSEEATRECEERGIHCLVGGCPLMYCEPVDFGHRCMRWWLRRRGRVPG
jgi:predicted CoA-binding protein